MAKTKAALNITTPLADDKLMCRSLIGHEALSEPFEFTLELLSYDRALKLDDLLGKSVTVHMRLEKNKERHFNGLVSRFCYVGASGRYAAYQVTLRPWLWFLTRTADCRIFQEKKVPEILKEVFRGHGFSDFKERLSATYRKREYCVQYRETDFNFASRLMEDEGIYYYFTHKKGSHEMVLTDSPSGHDPYPGYAKVEYEPLDEKDLLERERIHKWVVYQEVQPGAYALDAFDFEKPKTQLLARSAKPAKHPHADLEVFDYPGTYIESADGEQYVKVRREALQARYEQADGMANARGLAAGHTVEMSEYPRKDQNRKYLLLASDYEIRTDEHEMGIADRRGLEFRCQFRAMDSQRPYRPARVTPKARVRGPQTAVVVGKDGEEIWTDKYARVKLQFHWDRYGKSDEKSSCWVRVSQLWAGKKWGGMFIPRIGHEVVVDFLEGDPDRPLVTGRVYNGDNMPPYGLPDNRTRSTVQTRSSLKGTQETFNELRFEDKKNEEEVYFHAEKDFNRVVENDDTLKVGFDKKDKGDQTIEVFNNQTVKIGTSEADDGSQTIEIYKDRTTTLKTGDETLTITSGDRTIKISAGKSTTTAAQSIELKVGGSSIKIEPAKITLKAAQIAIQGDAQVDVKSPMTNVSGDAMLVLKGGLVKIN